MTAKPKVNNKSKNKYKNELIEKRRKKVRIKRYITIIIILISLAVTLCLKLSYFNIKDIQISNNRNISSEEIKKLSQINLGENIFYLNLKKSRTSILSNPYILNVEIKRKLPNKINIHVEERTAVFYVNKDNKYWVIDKNGIVLEEKNSVNGMKLLKLIGYEGKQYKLGEVLDDSNQRKIKLINDITELIRNFKDGIPEPSIVDIKDLTDIKMYYGNMMVKIGTSDKLQEKINKAINILLDNKLIDKKGYIDVSFKGNPVFLVEN
ncbi:cell division protein FtsQ/DivIB [Clostridium ganghwense]|uniref:FtsQ-type POTRA domain-containing protein n=1 Tax=Clostridium ganghwense TaxID=312089 RepID=A0ABT4CN26_9CLOT|nr:FtsQ-type POTRA domain-containing protein [Clostridium ganghwense]MCY6370353.1 FtsQ-type POTRA domain-containing protein [Clostridium ganghwense]